MASARKSEPRRVHGIMEISKAWIKERLQDGMLCITSHDSSLVTRYGHTVCNGLPASLLSQLTEPRLLVLDGHVTSGGVLVLFSNEVGDLLVLGLFDG